MQATLSGTARRYLRSLGHHLQPVVQVGKEGVTKALIAATKSALATHELIKVRISDNTDGDRHEVADALAKESAADLVGLTGRTVLLYRRHPSKPKIELPKVGKEKEKADKKAKKDAKKKSAAKGGKSDTTAGASTKKAAARKTTKSEAPATEDSSDLDVPDDGDDDGDFDETEYN